MSSPLDNKEPAQEPVPAAPGGTETPAQEPAELKKQTAAPPGTVPKRAQQYLVAGVTMLIVLIAMFAGHSAPKRASASASADPANEMAPPATAEIAQFQRQMEHIQRIQMAIAAHRRSPQMGGHEGVGDSGMLGSEGSGYPQTGGYPGGDPPPQPDPIVQQEREREYQSLFASNVALSYRPADPQPTPAPAAPPAQQADLGELLAALQATQPPSASAPWGQGAAAPAPTPQPTATPHVADAPPPGQYVLFEGTIIDAVLLNRLVGDFSGPVECMVTHAVYSPDLKHLLIPAGAKLLGEARNVAAFGQRRLAVSFHRLILPNGQSRDLDQFVGLNQSGATGLRDKVNHHYFQIFGTSMAVGLIGGAAMASTNAGLSESGKDMYIQGVSAGMSQASTQVLDRFLNVMPEITIREGHRVEVYLTSDLMLPVYQPPAEAAAIPGGSE